MKGAVGIQDRIHENLSHRAGRGVRVAEPQSHRGGEVSTGALARHEHCSRWDIEPGWIVQCPSGDPFAVVQAGWIWVLGRQAIPHGDDNGPGGVSEFPGDAVHEGDASYAPSSSVEVHDESGWLMGVLVDPDRNSGNGLIVHTGDLPGNRKIK
jgi:hypothetical protein